MKVSVKFSKKIVSKVLENKQSIDFNFSLINFNLVNLNSDLREVKQDHLHYDHFPEISLIII